MKHAPAGLLLLALACAPAQAQDPVIQTLVDRVDLVRLHADVDALVAFGTRRSDEPGGLAAQGWVYDRFLACGFPPPDLRLQDYGSYADNVIVTIPGLVAPGEIHVLGAHYDSINGAGPGLAAPGADDNGTGTAGLLEIARIIQESGLGFEATITIAAFAEEEFNRVGSKAFVDAEITAGRAPATGVVMDVLGYWKPGSTWNVAIGTPDPADPAMFPLRDVATGSVDTYLAGTPWEWGSTCT